MLDTLILTGSSWPYLVVFLFLPIAIYSTYIRSKKRDKKNDEK